MKPKAIIIRLPADLEKRGREIAGARHLHTVILEALRAQWMHPLMYIIAGKGTIEPFTGQIEPAEVYPTYGSIPARKSNA